MQKTLCKKFLCKVFCVNCRLLHKTMQEKNTKSSQNLNKFVFFTNICAKQNIQNLVSARDFIK